MQQLNQAQIDALQDLINNDSDFRKIVQKKIKERADRAQEAAKALSQAQNLFSPGSKPKGNRTKHVKAGSRNHRPAIMSAVEAKPGMTVSELRDALKGAKHEIGDKTLNTLLNTMKKEFVKSNGEKGLRTEGEKPSTRFYTK